MIDEIDIFPVFSECFMGYRWERYAFIGVTVETYVTFVCCTFSVFTHGGSVLPLWVDNMPDTKRKGNKAIISNCMF